MSPHPDDRLLDDLDTLGGVPRRRLLEHLRECRSCRTRLAGRRPEALFALLALDPLPSAALERLSRNVAAAVDDGRRSRRGWSAAAALAASVALALLLGSPSPDPTGGTRIAVASPQPALGEVAAPVRGVELLSSPGEAEVWDFAIGDAQVVMIFDKEFDI